MTTFWNQNGDAKMSDLMRELALIPSLANTEGVFDFVFGLPACATKHITGVDVSDPTRRRKATGVSQDTLTKQLFGAFVSVALGMYADVGQEPGRTVSVAASSTVNVSFVLHARGGGGGSIQPPVTYDGLEEEYNCIVATITYQHNDKHINIPPLLVYFWCEVFGPGEQRRYYDIAVIQVETPRNPRALLNASGKPQQSVAEVYAALVSMHTRGISHQLTDRGVQREVQCTPWSTNLMHDIDLKVFNTHSATEARMSDARLSLCRQFPLFCTAPRSDEYLSRVNATLRGRNKSTQIEYTRHWHTYSGVHEHTYVSRHTVWNPTEVLPCTALLFSASAGKQVTGSITQVRVRETGDILFTIAGRNSPVFNAANAMRVGQVDAVSSTLLAAAFAADDHGSLVTVEKGNLPRVMPTVLFQAWRNAGLGTPRTLVHAEQPRALSRLLSELFVDTGLKLDSAGEEAGALLLKWARPGYYFAPGREQRGILEIRQCTTAIGSLCGLFSEQQDWHGPGERNSVVVVEDLNRAVWHPMDQRNSSCKRWSPLLYIDTGRSLVGRYLLQDHIDVNILNKAKVALPASLRDHALVSNSLKEYVGPVYSDAVDLIVDLEFTDGSDEQGKVATAIAAVLVQERSPRAILGELVANDPPVSERLAKGANVNERTQYAAGQTHRNALKRWRTQVGAKFTLVNDVRDAATLLGDILTIGKVLPIPVRVWCKGADNDRILLYCAREGKNVMVRNRPQLVKEAQKSVFQDISDFGAAVPTYNALTKLHHLPAIHNPVNEVLGFAIDASLMERDETKINKARTSNWDLDNFAREFERAIVMAGFAHSFKEGVLIHHEWAEKSKEFGNKTDLKLLAAQHCARKKILLDRFIAEGLSQAFDDGQAADIMAYYNGQDRLGEET